MKRRKAFTLIEILIALTIFSFAMIISSGIFSMVVGNQSTVKVNSEVNRESQRIVRQIADQMINATKVGKTGVAGVNSPKGLAFFDQTLSIINPSVDCLNPVAAACDYNGIILFTDLGARLYYFDSTNKTIQYASDSSNTLKLDAANRIDISESTGYRFQNLNSKSVEILSSGFRGATCYSNSCNQSPVVMIDITTRTKDYDNKAPKNRAKLELRTMISSRNY